MCQTNTPYTNTLKYLATSFSAPTFDILCRAIHWELSLLWSSIHCEVDDFCCHVMNSEPLMFLCAPLICMWCLSHLIILMVNTPPPCFDSLHLLLLLLCSSFPFLLLYYNFFFQITKSVIIRINYLKKITLWIPPYFFSLRVYCFFYLFHLYCRQS